MNGEPGRNARGGTLRAGAAALGLIVLAGALAHGRAFAHNLPRHHWEDWRFFRHTRHHIHSVADCFTQPSLWPGLYRPLTTNCYYLAGRRLWGNRVEAYHAVNAALFVANGLLLFSIARRWLPLPLALLAPVLWVSRVAHRQVLLYTSEFQALLSVLLSLAALRLAMAARWPRGATAGGAGLEAAALGTFAAALLSKESAVVLPALVSVAGAAFAGAMHARRRWLRDAAWWAVAAAWAVLFALVLRGVGGHVPTGYSYDVSAAMARRLAAYALMFSNALVLPVDDWAVPPRLPALAGHPAVLAALALAAVAVASLAALAGRLPAGLGAPARVMGFGLGWFVAGCAPFVVFEDRLFLRYAYFGHAGLALMLAALPGLAAEWWSSRAPLRPAARAATGPMSAPAPP